MSGVLRGQAEVEVEQGRWIDRGLLASRHLSVRYPTAQWWGGTTSQPRDNWAQKPKPFKKKIIYFRDRT